MKDEIRTTYRLVDSETGAYGQTALTPALAKRSLGQLSRNNLLGLERTDWDNQNERPKPVRTILVDAENAPGEWNAPV